MHLSFFLFDYGSSLKLVCYQNRVQQEQLLSLVSKLAPQNLRIAEMEFIMVQWARLRTFNKTFWQCQWISFCSIAHSCKTTTNNQVSRTVVRLAQNARIQKIKRAHMSVRISARVRLNETFKVSGTIPSTLINSSCYRFHFIRSQTLEHLTGRRPLG